MANEPPKVDTIGGFPAAIPICRACGKELLLENAWITDGCPCNSNLGCNSLNETRWRLLMQLQQNQARELEALRKFKAYVHERLDEAGIATHPDGPHSAKGCRVGDRLDSLIGQRAGG